MRKNEKKKHAVILSNFNFITGDFTVKSKLSEFYSDSVILLCYRPLENGHGKLTGRVDVVFQRGKKFFYAKRTIFFFFFKKPILMIKCEVL